MPPARTNPSDDFPPELLALGKFEVLKKLGEGGMGAVWKVRHKFLDRVVAIKVMNNDALGLPNARERFLREMRAGGKLSHPNVAQTIDAAEVGGVLFLVMEYVRGVSLERLVKTRGSLPVRFACRCAIEAAQGLQHAFEKGMVHRDIKPANLMILADRTVKVLDFGLARLPTDQGESRQTAYQTFMGTADYVSPEQAQNARGADIRSDIYSLGCTLYWLLSGKPPFGGDTVLEVASAHVAEEAKPLNNVPEELWAAIARMMAKKPKDRFQTPNEVIKALYPLTQSREVEVAEPAPEPEFSSLFDLEPDSPSRSRLRRRGMPAWAQGVAGLIASAVTTALILGAWRFAAPTEQPFKRETHKPLTIAQAGPKAIVPEGFVSLFNGKDLSGWRSSSDQQGVWTVSNGILVGSGKKTEYLLSDRSDYKNFHFYVKVKINPGGNSGQFFRAEFNERMTQFLEADLRSDGAYSQFGTLYLGQKVKFADGTSKVRPDAWFTQEVIAVDDKVTVKIDGVPLGEPAQIPSPSPARGRLALQVGLNTRIQVTTIAVKEVP